MCSFWISLIGMAVVCVLNGEFSCCSHQSYITCNILREVHIKELSLILQNFYHKFGI